jgi:hypothetical protein
MRKHAYLLQRSPLITPIIRLHWKRTILDLNNATRPESLKRMPKHLPHIAKTHRHHAPMHIIELRAEIPLLLSIADLELHVRRHELRLHGAQIDAHNPALGMQRREVNGPDSRPCADVEHVVQGCGERGRGQRAVEREPENVVLHIEPLLLLLVVGENVLAVPEGVVAAPVLFDGAGDAVSYAYGRALGVLAVVREIQMKDRNSVVLAKEIIGGWGVELGAAGLLVD